MKETLFLTEYHSKEDTVVKGQINALGKSYTDMLKSLQEEYNLNLNNIKDWAIKSGANKQLLEDNFCPMCKADLPPKK